MFALLAAGMATFGGAGLVVAVGIAAFWAWAYHAPAKTACGCGLAAFVVLSLVSLVSPAVQSVREVSRRAMCLNNLKQIALDVQNYENMKGSLPPAAMVDASGMPLHSWRTAILPFSEQQALYLRLSLDEPWNSRSNRGYTVNMQIGQFQCPAHADAPSTTHYFAVVGERTAWPPGRGRKISEIRDGTRNTLLVIEAPWKQAAWAEPADMTFEEAVDYLSRKPAPHEVVHEVRNGVFYKPTPVVHAAFADGRVRALPLPLPRETAIGLLTVDGGELIDEDALEAERAAELDYGRCYALLALVLLSIIPGIRLYFRRRSARQEATQPPGAS